MARRRAFRMALLVAVVFVIAILVPTCANTINSSYLREQIVPTLPSRESQPDPSPPPSEPTQVRPEHSEKQPGQSDEQQRQDTPNSAAKSVEAPSLSLHERNEGQTQHQSEATTAVEESSHPSPHNAHSGANVGDKSSVSDHSKQKESHSHGHHSTHNDSGSAKAGGKSAYVSGKSVQSDRANRESSEHKSHTSSSSDDSGHDDSYSGPEFAIHESPASGRPIETRNICEEESGDDSGQLWRKKGNGPWKLDDSKKEACRRHKMNSWSVHPKQWPGWGPAWNDIKKEWDKLGPPKGIDPLSPRYHPAETVDRLKKFQKLTADEKRKMAAAGDIKG